MTVAEPIAARRGPPEGARRRTVWVLVVIAAGIGVLTALLAFGLTRDPTRLRSNLEGRPAPDFSLATLDRSGSVRLADLHGQVVVINFWASWCAECRIEEPALAAAWQRYRDQRVVVVGISFQDTIADSLAYAVRNRIDWPLLADPGSATGLKYGVSGIPETVFVARDGRVAAKVVGPVSDPLLSDRISALLAERVP